MNEELNTMLGKILQKTPAMVQSKNPEPSQGQVWFPHYSQEMQELLKTTPLLQKCRPVYIHTINGSRVTCFKVKTLHTPIAIPTDGRRVSEVVYRDPASEVRVLECTEILTLHIQDFKDGGARYLYTLDDTIQMLATITYANAMGIPVVMSTETTDCLREYWLKLVSVSSSKPNAPATPAVSEGISKIPYQSQIDKFNQKWGRVHTVASGKQDTKPKEPTTCEPPAPAKTEENQNPKNDEPKKRVRGKQRTFKYGKAEKKLIPAICEYISHIPETLKFANSEGEFTPNHDGYIDDNGLIVIATSIHKTIYLQMASDGIMLEARSSGYYVYRAMMMDSAILTDDYLTFRGVGGSDRKMSITRFNIKAASSERG